MEKKIRKIENEAKHAKQSGGSNILGHELRSDPYANIFLCGRKKSGKTVAIKMILDVCLPKKIPVIIICPSLDTDANWRDMIDWLKKRGNEVFEYYGIINPDTGENNLVTIMKHMEKLNRKDPNHLTAKGLKYMLIMDDCGKQMRNSIVYQFLLKNRHEKCGTILSGQSMKNIQPDVRQQIGLWLLFPKLNEKDLKLIYEDSDPPVSWEEFEAKYEKATSAQYSFLYFTPDGDFRTKFQKDAKPPTKENKKPDAKRPKQIQLGGNIFDEILEFFGLRSKHDYSKLSPEMKLKVQKSIREMNEVLEGKRPL
jgi:hypothetical protein